ncbi:MAG: cobalamin-binding protein [Acidobacteriia bacterium]|nr:cobalamin-binding protein [Terriglobia bacterium]
MKIASLLPSSTEIVYALGLGDELVAVSHECDFPPEAMNKPKMTRARVDSNLSSHEIDTLVSSTLHESGSIYDLDFDLLQKVQPDVILTQQLCDVCAVSYEYVRDAVKGLRSSPTVVNLEPTCLNDILENILTVGQLTGRQERAEKLVQDLKGRIDRVREAVARFNNHPRTLLMEWIDPPFCGGHWNGELVEIAGGVDRLAQFKKPSRRLTWEEIESFAPEIVVVSCCGFSIERTLRETPLLKNIEAWNRLPAVRQGRIFVADGNQYFSRPGPRIVDSLEMMAVMIHPDLASTLSIPADGFQKLGF